jgi:hypothetical protein
MKNVKIALLVFGISTLAIAGCKKHSCFHCYVLTGGFVCSKNGYTYTSPAIPNRLWLQDSVNLYISRGYTMDTVIGYYNDAGTICDTPQGPYPIFPDSCVFLHYKL